MRRETSFEQLDIEERERIEAFRALVKGDASSPHVQDRAEAVYLIREIEKMWKLIPRRVKASDRRFLETWKLYLKRSDAVFGKHRMQTLRDVASTYYVDVRGLDEARKHFSNKGNGDYD